MDRIDREHRGRCDQRCDRREDREPASQQKVLDRIAVDRDPAEQLAGAQLGDAIAGEAQRSREEARAQRPGEIERGLMGADALAVARQRASPGERSHPSAGKQERKRAGDRQAGDRGGGDEPSGEGEQAGAEYEGQYHRRGRLGQPSAGRRALGPFTEQYADRAGAAHAATPTAARLAARDQLTAIEGDHAIADGEHGGRVAGQDCRGRPRERGDDLDDRRLARGVEVSGRLVQNHQRRASEKCARERHPMRLPAREAPPPLADRGLQAFRKPRQHNAEAGRERRAADVEVVCLGPAERDVVLKGPGEQIRALAEPADRSSLDATRRHAVEQHDAGRGLELAGEHAEQRGFPGARGAGNADHLAGPDRQRHVAQRRQLTPREDDGQPGDLDCGRAGQRPRDRALHVSRAGLQERLKGFDRRQRICALVIGRGERSDRLEVQRRDHQQEQPGAQ
jgi:hypothetical protein